MAGITFWLLASLRLLNCTGIDWTLWTGLLGTFAGGTFCSSKSMSNSACQSVSAKRKSTSVVLISLDFFSLLPTFEIFSVLDGTVVFANFWPQRFVRVSFKQSEISRFFLSLNLVWMSKSVLSSVCLFICKTKLKTLRNGLFPVRRVVLQ